MGRAYAGYALAPMLSRHAFSPASTDGCAGGVGHRPDVGRTSGARREVSLRGASRSCTVLEASGQSRRPDAHGERTIAAPAYSSWSLPPHAANVVALKRARESPLDLGRRG